MILFIGQAAQSQLDREAFQEVDFRAMFTPLAKWAAEIREADRIPEYVARAFHVATSGRPGPVVLSLPEDVLAATRRGPLAGPISAPSRRRRANRCAAPHAMLMRAAEPFLVLGGTRLDGRVHRRHPQIRRSPRPARLHHLPRQGSFRQHATRIIAAISASAPIPALVARIEKSDLLLVVGARLGEMTTNGYTRLYPALAETDARSMSIPSPDELNRVYQADLAIAASVGSFAAQCGGDHRAGARAWRRLRRDARAQYRELRKPVAAPGDVNPSEIFAWLSQRLPADAILANGAGNYAAWLHRFYRYRGLADPAGPTSGAMGYGVPAAIAAKLLHPDRVVVSATGDGCFLMNGQELATAVQYGAGRSSPRLRQRHVRHHPHAPGARISRRTSSAPS